jgi:hypothetical protein
LDLLELIITASILVGILVGAVVRSFVTATAVGAIGSIAVLSGLLGSPTLGLILLALLGLVLEDKTTELQAKVDITDLTTSLAVKGNVVILDNNVGLRVLALFAENELVDEAIEVILELGSIVGTVDDPAVVLGVNVGLGTKFETKVLDDVGAGTGERGCNAAEVDNDGLDTVSFTFDLGLQTLHLVTIESIADIAANVDESHDDGIE